LAQWAVNVVDFYDRDSIMTRFDYTENPFTSAGWNPPGDQTYYQLCMFSKSIGLRVVVDERASLFAATHGVSDECFTVADGALLCDGARPHVLHCNSNDKHDRKRAFMRKLNIPVRG
jgi:hypothetical protein